MENEIRKTGGENSLEERFVESSPFLGRIKMNKCQLIFRLSPNGECPAKSETLKQVPEADTAVDSEVQKRDKTGDEKLIHVRKQGFPLSLFDSIEGSRFPFNHVKDVMDVFLNAHKLTIRQRIMLSKAIEEAWAHHQNGANEFREIRTALRSISLRDESLLDDVNTILDFYFELLYVAFTWPVPIFIPGKRTILDLSGFDSMTQGMLTEFALMSLRSIADKGGT